MPISFNEFKEHWWRLRTNDNQDIFDVMGSLLSAPTKQAILTDLNTPVEGAKLIVLEERRNAIKEFAAKLPANDPLRLAIENVPK